MVRAMGHLSFTTAVLEAHRTHTRLFDVVLIRIKRKRNCRLGQSVRPLSLEFRLQALLL